MAKQVKTLTMNSLQLEFHPQNSREVDNQLINVIFQLCLNVHACTVNK